MWPKDFPMPSLHYGDDIEAGFVRFPEEWFEADASLRADLLLNWIAILEDECLDMLEEEKSESSLN